jgi:hypothetical protein
MRGGKKMNLRHLLIFTFVFMLICVLGSQYMLKEEANPVSMHTSQREIERDLQLPYKASFKQTQIDHQTIVTNEPTVQDIKDTYQKKFEALQKTTNEQVDSLLKQAISEYKSKIKSSEDPLFIHFYQKYTKEGQALEKKTDKAFYTIHEQLINELKQHGFSEKIADEFKNTYLKQKEKRQMEIFKSFLSLIG